MQLRRNLNVAVIFAAGLLAGSAQLLRADSPTTAPSTQPSAGATGTWKWQVEGPGGDVDVVLKLKQDGENLTGTITGFGGDESAIQDGKIHDAQITFKVVRDFNGRPFTTNYTGTLSGDEFKGKSETIFAQDFDGKRSKD